MFLHVKTAHHTRDYRLWLEFDNGEAGEVDLARELWGEMFAPLQDPAQFSAAYIDEEMLTVAWPNGADFAPEFLLELLHSQHHQAA